MFVIQHSLPSDDHVEVMVEISHGLLQPIERQSQPPDAVLADAFVPQLRRSHQSSGGLIHESCSCIGV